MLTDPDGGTVDHHQFAVESLRDRRQKPIPHTCFAPANEAVVAGGVRTIALGNICPGAACAKAPQYPVDHSAIIDTRHAAWLVGKQRLDHNHSKSVSSKRRRICKAPFSSLESINLASRNSVYEFTA